MKQAKFVRLFQARFAPLVESGEKTHTARPQPKRMPRPGDFISLRAWTGRPYRSEQRVLRETTITKVQRIKIEEGAVWPNIWIDGKRLNASETVAFAKADGFVDPGDMMDWFTAQHGVRFTGILIHWNPSL